MKKIILLSLSIIFCILSSSCGNSSSATPDSASEKEKTTAIQTTVASSNVLSTTIPPTTVTPTTVAPITLPPTTVHTHQWEDITSVIHHNAEMGQVWVVDKPASSSMEFHYNAFCTYCNAKWSYDSATDTIPIERLWDAMYAHRDECEKKWRLAHGDDASFPSIVYTLSESYEHKTPEEGHYENQVIKEAYDETVVTGQKCKTCGEYKKVN